ncbi:MAG: secondary thiamine-phosphate synthase enzyme YjbQ [Desulfurococcaceae archaeon]
MVKVHTEVLRLKTTERFQLIDITKEVEGVVDRSGVSSGIVLVFAPHATACIITNEKEKGLMEDIIRKTMEFTEPGSSKWMHNKIDDNAHAHIGSALFGSERIFPIVNKHVVRGTWQNIFFFEMDGPRPYREVYILAIGE